MFMPLLSQELVTVFGLDGSVTTFPPRPWPLDEARPGGGRVWRGCPPTPGFPSQRLAVDSSCSNHDTVHPVTLRRHCLLRPGLRS